MDSTYGVAGAVTQFLGGEPACACCTRVEYPAGQELLPLDEVGPALIAHRGTGTIRCVEIVPGKLWGNVCEACTDAQCNGCMRCAGHCECPPDTGRPAWILPTDAELAAMPPLEGPFTTAVVQGERRQ